MDRSREYNDLEWAIGLNRGMLKIVGLWPQEKDKHEELLSKLRLLFNVIMLIFILTIPALASLIRVWGDMMLMIDNLQYTLPLLIVTLKIFIMWYKKRALSPLIKMIVKDWMKMKLEEERNVMLKQARIIRLLAACGMLMMLLAFILSTSYFLFGRTFRYVTNFTDPFGKPLPMQAYYLHDISTSPKYELTYLMQAVGIILPGICYTGIDNFLGLLILHICGQMENLHLRLLNLGKEPNFKAALKYNVKDHIRLIRSIEIIDNSFNLMLLCMIFFFTVIFCLLTFLLMNVNRGGNLSLMQLIWCVSANVTLFLHMCLYCAVGELLVTQSEKIHSVTYEYIWYTLEPKAAKNLILIMLRAKKPLNITAGKIFPMTMSTFCNLLKTSASYVSVLLASQDCDTITIQI